MSAPSHTKIFGMKIKADPKIIVGVLIATAIGLFWYNSHSDDDSGPAASGIRHEAAPSAAPIPVKPVAAIRQRRSSQNSDDRGTLRFRPIDPTRGDVDPTLRLDLLARLQNVEVGAAGRSLFELGPAPLSAADQAVLKNPPPIKRPNLTPPITPTTLAHPMEEVLNIPLKYYGFVKSGEKSLGDEGLFLDGDNVVVGAEGEVVLKKYLVVALTPNTARLEDTQLKKGQTLNVVPAATP